MRELINRPIYLEQLIQHKDKDLIKIITGIRRSGKSSILDLFHEYLINSGVKEKNIIHINLESLKFRDFKDYISFYDYIAKKISKKGKTYLILDELQSVESWEKAIESFRIDFNVDIYITGSNAYLLSTEFSTLLSGRYVEIKVMPLSFKEFLNFNKFSTNITIDEKFQKYLQFGGMPVLSEYNFDELMSNQVLEGIYSTILIKDILQRVSSADQNTLQKIIMYLCSNIGSITSPNNIGNVLSAEGNIVCKKNNIVGKTVEKYISYLRNAFFFFSVGRYDVKGKQLLKTLEKNYIIDIGFRNILLGYRDADRGHILENIVFLELLRRNYKVYIGKIGEKEVDFIAEKANEKIYIQVTESMLTKETAERELRPLQMINDNYEKIILSMDRNYINSYEGIKNLNLIDWLLENNI